MVSQSQSLFTDTRSHFRVNDNRRILWAIDQGAQRGQAKIRNLSASGMLLETNGTFIPPKEGCVFHFDTTLGHDNYIPERGQLVWSRKVSRVKNRYHCGIEFVEPAEYVQTKLRKRIQKGILKITTTKRITRSLSAVLTAAIVGLTGYTIWMSQDVYVGLSASTESLLDVSGKQAALTRDYAQRYQSSQEQLATVTQELEATKQMHLESQAQLKTVSQDLNQTKMILAQTEAMLVQASSGANQLESDFNAIVEQNQERFATAKVQLENEITTLQSRNTELAKEVNTLSEQLSFYEGNVKNIDEGYVLVNIYRERMKAVKKKIKGFKSEVRDLRKKAQNERDRIQLAIGNNGYFTKDGKAVEVDMEQYIAAGNAPVVIKENGHGLPPNVEVSVTNFK